VRDEIGVVSANVSWYINDVFINDTEDYNWTVPYNQDNILSVLKVNVTKAGYGQD
jgi:hypothetical protein